MDWLMSKLGFKREMEVETPKDISEPVISFLKVFESNPRRFKVKETFHTSGVICGGYSPYKLIDTYSKESFKFQRSWHYYPEDRLYGIKDLPDFLTFDEKKLVIKTIWEYYSGRKSKLEYLKGIRKERNKSKERKRLTKIYQEEV